MFLFAAVLAGAGLALTLSGGPRVQSGTVRHFRRPVLVSATLELLAFLTPTAIEAPGSDPPSGTELPNDPGKDGRSSIEMDEEMDELSAQRVVQGGDGGSR